VLHREPVQKEAPGAVHPGPATVTRLTPNQVKIWFQNHRYKMKKQGKQQDPKADLGQEAHRTCNNSPLLLSLILHCFLPQILPAH
uniref:Homeobox domain-containing protein n=1 Tax=Podarcis muralis TaxID=64176 RepID=A0A670IMG0_PODMU